MGCQKDIAARIRAKGAEYLLALKANHGRAFEAAREHFERTCFGTVNFAACRFADRERVG
jgi:predicted transposase YbfD/YdcC